MHYEFTEARVIAVRAGGQGGLVVGIEATGTATIAGGATTKLTKVFGVRRYGKDRWLIVDAWDPGHVEAVR